MSLLIACLADDFTGATDALESLSLAGLNTMMFAEAPSPMEIEAMPGLQAVVVASAARSMTKPELESVRPILVALRDLKAHHTVYKVCSTFDSSPDRGSVGRVIEIGADVFDQALVPVVPGAPALGRYVVFGNLFAAGSIALEGDVFRLDRHPVMSRHPVTPMGESDLVRHLKCQTDRSIGLFDIRKLALAEPERRQAWVSSRNGNGILLCDLLNVDQQRLLGSLLEGDRFLVGSSGVTSSLGAYWDAHGVCKARTEWPSVKPNGPILVVSGSCSTVTGRQIETAIAAGWAGVDALGAAAVTEAVTELLAGRNTILHTCIGPDDPRRSGVQSDLGKRLGKAVRDVLVKTPSLRRLVFAGGDTSSHALSELGVEAFRMMTRIAPGAPLCKGDDLEIVCKGGQAGMADFFLQSEGLR